MTGSILAFFLCLAMVVAFMFQVAVNEGYNDRLNRETLELCHKYDAANVTPRCQKLAQ